MIRRYILSLYNGLMNEITMFINYDPTPSKKQKKKNRYMFLNESHDRPYKK